MLADGATIGDIYRALSFDVRQEVGVIIKGISQPFKITAPHLPRMKIIHGWMSWKERIKSI